MAFHEPTQWKLTPKGTNLLGHSVIPPGMDKSKGIKSKHTSWRKRELNAHIQMFFKIGVTHTMIPRLITSWSKTYCYFRNRLVGWMLLLLIYKLHWRKYGPSRDKLRSSGSWHSMSRTCGHRDMISLVIPRVRDNKFQRWHNKSL